MNDEYKGEATRRKQIQRIIESENFEGSDDLRSECLNFMNSCGTDIDALHRLSGLIGKQTEKEDLIDSGILEFVRHMLETQKLSPLTFPIAKFCRKWSIIDNDFGYLLFNEKVVGDMCDMIVKIVELEGEEPDRICENFLIAIANLLLDLSQQLSENMLNRIVDISIQGYLYFGNKKNALAANVFLTTVLAHTFKDRIVLDTFIAWAEDISKLLGNESKSFYPERLCSAALSSLCHILVCPQVERFFATPKFLQEVLPVYVALDECLVNAYSVFCKLATSSDEAIRKSTLSLSPLQKIAEKFESSGIEEKMTFCATIAEVISENPEDLFLFDECGVITTISSLASP